MNKDRRVRHGHGSSKERSPTYTSWSSMMTRCFNEEATGYPDYGGRGISVASRWTDFTAFLKDMGVRPQGTTLDRIDPCGHYEPDNCRWATPREQARNRRTSHLITFKGETKTVAEWADERGLPYNALLKRLRRWCPTKSLLLPINRTKQRNGGGIDE